MTFWNFTSEVKQIFSLIIPLLKGLRFEMATEWVGEIVFFQLVPHNIPRAPIQISPRIYGLLLQFWIIKRKPYSFCILIYTIYILMSYGFHDFFYVYAAQALNLFIVIQIIKERYAYCNNFKLNIPIESNVQHKCI